VSASAGLGVCTDCSAGMVATSDGLTACTPCPAGEYAPFTGLAVCTPCAAGKFSVATGSGVCDDCPGDESSAEGSSKCDRCNAGFFYSGAGRCEKEPEGVKCGQGECTLELLQLSPGYWRIASDSAEVYACPLPEACAGGLGDAGTTRRTLLSDFGDGYCAEGYTGTLCALCADGYLLDDETQTCETSVCSTGGGASSRAFSTLAVLALFVGGVVAGVWCYVRRLRKGLLGSGGGIGPAHLHQVHKEVTKVWKSAATRAKALVAFMQIVSSVAFNCSIVFPPIFERVLGILGIFNLDVVPALGLQCWFDSFDYIKKLVMVTVGPLAIAVVLGVQYALTLCCSSDPAKKKKRVQLVSYLFLMLTFLVLVSTSTTLFHCESAPACATSLLHLSYV